LTWKIYSELFSDRLFLPNHKFGNMYCSSSTQVPH